MPQLVQEKSGAYVLVSPLRRLDPVELTSIPIWYPQLVEFRVDNPSVSSVLSRHHLAVYSSLDE